MSLKDKLAGQNAEFFSPLQKRKFQLAERRAKELIAAHAQHFKKVPPIVFARLSPEADASLHMNACAFVCPAGMAYIAFCARLIGGYSENSGLIRIVNNNVDFRRFDAVLLHEMGHCLGGNHEFITHLRPKIERRLYAAILGSFLVTPSLAWAGVSVSALLSAEAVMSYVNFAEEKKADYFSAAIMNSGLSGADVLSELYAEEAEVLFHRENISNSLLEPHPSLRARKLVAYQALAGMRPVNIIE